jgi:hypothetical protein
MKPIRKKNLWAIIVFFALILVILVALPFVFEDKIKTIAKNELNKKINAVVDFEDLDLSFLRSFPHVSLRFTGFSFTGIGDFEKDTMLQSNNIDLTVNIKSFFKDHGYDIGNLKFNNAKIYFHYLNDGQFNWTSFLKEDTTVIDTTPTRFHFKLKEFIVENSDLVYRDDEGDVSLSLEGLHLNVAGDLTADSSLLKTKLSAESLNFSNDGFAYISNVKLKLDADINANINERIFYLSDNFMQMNDLPFSLNGWFRTVKGGIAMDFKLKTETVQFKSLLSLIPVFYAQSFNQIKAGGKVEVKGFLKGEYAGDYYPSFNLDLNVADAWFQYPSLPKKVEKINIKANLLNTGNTLDETVIDISKFLFELGGNPFSAKLRIATPDTDPDIKLKAKGKINLGSIKEVYPLDKDLTLRGLIKVDLNLDGRMSYYEKNMYDKFSFGGSVNLADISLNLRNFNDPFEIHTADFTFNNRYVNLAGFSAKLGKNDISADGRLENFLMYLLSDKTLKGSFMINSNYLNINDFMTNSKVADTITTNTKDIAKVTRPLILPSNLDLTMTGNFGEIIYDKMNLKNASGKLTLANSMLKFNDLSVQAFGGYFKLNGSYNTVDTLKPAIDFSLALNEVVFNDIFKQVDVIQNFAPLFNKATGKFNTFLTLSSTLKTDMMPDLMTVFSQGKFNTKSVALKDVPVLEKIAMVLNRKDLLPMTLNDLGVSFEINKGKLLTKPFNFKIKDIGFTIGGITGLDKTINYMGTVTLPDKLNLGRFSTYNITISGTFSKPEVKLDLKGKVTELATETAAKVETEVNKKVDEVKEEAIQEARRQKEKAMNEAQKKADKLIAAADSVGNLLILQAEKQGQDLVKKANNPITKAAAEIASKKLVEEARKKAAEGKAKAQTEAQKIIQKAAESVEI